MPLNLLKALPLSLAAFLVNPASAAVVDCAAVSSTKNYMTINDTEVLSCAGAGVGNIGNDQKNDDWIKTLGGVDVPGTLGSFQTYYTQSKVTDGAHQDTIGRLDISALSYLQDIEFIGFKFGTGNQPDEWFVFEFDAAAVGGGIVDYTFHNINGKGGGLSHVTFYGGESGGGECESSDPNCVEVPEPSALALVGLGLLGLYGVRRRRAR